MVLWLRFIFNDVIFWIFRNSGDLSYLVVVNGCDKIVDPSFKGVYGTKATALVNDKEQQVTVDDNYILESVYEPNAKIVKGFQPNLMQPFKDIITKEEVKDIAEYIKSLK